MQNSVILARCGQNGNPFWPHLARMLHLPALSSWDTIWSHLARSAQNHNQICPDVVRSDWHSAQICPEQNIRQMWSDAIGNVPRSGQNKLMNGSKLGYNEICPDLVTMLIRSDQIWAECISDVTRSSQICTAIHSDVPCFLHTNTC